MQFPINYRDIISRHHQLWMSMICGTANIREASYYCDKEESSSKIRKSVFFDPIVRCQIDSAFNACDLFGKLH